MKKNTLFYKYITIFFATTLNLSHNVQLYFSSAPGTYDVEKAEKATHQSTGGIIFGIKYKDPKPDEIPGNFSFDNFTINLIFRYSYSQNNINLKTVK